MATIKRKFKLGSCYHVYNRAVNRSKIFFNQKNYNFFLSRIEHFKNVTGVEILAYVILPNHYHFLMREKINKKAKFKGSCVYAINQFISRLENSYAKYYNMWSGHSGAVWQGPFRARELYDEYDEGVILNYIKTNPIKHKLVDKCDCWEYVFNNPSGC